MQAQEPDKIATISMKQHLGIGHIAARLRIGIIATEILHVAEDVALVVLRHGIAEIATEPKIRDRRLLAIEALNGEILQHDDAATIGQLAIHVREHVGKANEW